MFLNNRIILMCCISVQKTGTAIAITLRDNNMKGNY
jgi:hypothetical protein